MNLLDRGFQRFSLPPELVLATHNPGKLREIALILSDLAITLLPQSHFNISDAEETGLTFVENALLKARHAAVGSNLPAIADDSGLEVDALQGAPGIYSARYAGKGASDRDNLETLLRALAGVPEPLRTARFHCMIVYLRYPADPAPLLCHGVWEGQLLFEPRGDNGFGYDPIFYVPTHECSAAELVPAIKNQLSHRAQALRQLQRSFAAQYAPHA